MKSCYCRLTFHWKQKTLPLGETLGVRAVSEALLGVAKPNMR